MSRTPRVYIEKENEFDVKDVTEPKPINLERLDKWVIKDHTKPRDLVFELSVGAGEGGGGGKYISIVIFHEMLAGDNPAIKLQYPIDNDAASVSIPIGAISVDAETGDSYYEDEPASTESRFEPRMIEGSDGLNATVDYDHITISTESGMPFDNDAIIAFEFIERI